MTRIQDAIAGKWFVARTHIDEQRRLFVELEMMTSLPDIDDPVIDDEGEIIMFQSMEQLQDLMAVLSAIKSRLKERTDAGDRMEVGGVARLLTNRY